MIYLTWTVDNINVVIQAYNQICIERGPAESGPFTTVSGLGPIILVASQNTYTEVDDYGTITDWYRSRYYNSVTNYYSGWSDPVLGEAGVIYHNPLYPPEVSYGTAQRLVIDRIRRLIGDPIGLNREHGPEAASSIHFDNKTYELDEKGWPAAIHMGGVAMNDATDPIINGYRYLVFDEDISVTTWSGGIGYGVDIFYYIFRHSDREIMEAYDNCPVPVGLTIATANSEAYMLQTAITLLGQEIIEDSVEDGAIITDESSKYDNTKAIQFKIDMLDRLQKRLDAIPDDAKSSLLRNITGVLID